MRHLKTHLGERAAKVGVAREIGAVNLGVGRLVQPLQALGERRM